MQSEAKKYNRKWIIFSLSVSTKSILNVTVLAAYLEMPDILAALPSMAKRLRVKNYAHGDLVARGNALGNATVVGLEHFVNSGFSNPNFDLNQTISQAKPHPTATNGEMTKKRKSQTVQSEPDSKKSKPDKVKTKTYFLI